MTFPPGGLPRFDRPRETALREVGTKALVQELLRRAEADDLVARGDVEAEPFGILGFELERRSDLSHNRFSRRRMAETVGIALAYLQQPGKRIEGSVFVELGCGSVNPLSALFTLVLLGARRCIGIDLDPPQRIDYATLALARCAGYLLSEPRLLLPHHPVSRQDMVRNLEGFDMLKLYQGDPGGIDATRLQLRRESITAIGLPDESVDMTYSTSLLEHVDDLRLACAEVFRITKPGGLAYHYIDGYDHVHYTDPNRHPYDFLRAPDEQAMVGGCNRVRPTEYPALFERAGFEVLRFDETAHLQVDEALRSGFAPRFRQMSLQTLSIARCGVFARKR